MVTGMFIGFGVMCFALCVMGWLIWCRLADHLRDNPVAVAAVAEHVLVPLVGRKKEKKKADKGPEAEAVPAEMQDGGAEPEVAGRTDTKRTKGARLV